jgi:LmbE family N-acetylglucosaminyl deacetylase
MSNQNEGCRVLVIAAHPDDELLGAGATFAKRLRAGDEVHAVVVCEGETVRYQPAGQSVRQQDHAHKAAAALGFTSFRCLMLPDQRLDTISQLDLNQKLEQLIDQVRPAVVYTHFHGDINRDHQVLHDSVMVATRPGRDFVREVLAFETPSSTGLWSKHCFNPDTFEVVTDTLEVKLAAMACYETEALAYPHPRSIESLRCRARYWGSIIHQPAAEAFMTLRRIRT